MLMPHQNSNEYHLQLGADLLLHKLKKWQGEYVLQVKLFQTNEGRLNLTHFCPIFPTQKHTRRENSSHYRWVICIHMDSPDSWQKERVYLREIYTEDWLLRQMLVSVALLLRGQGGISWGLRFNEDSWRADQTAATENKLQAIRSTSDPFSSMLSFAHNLSSDSYFSAKTKPAFLLRT